MGVSGGGYWLAICGYDRYAARRISVGAAEGIPAEMVLERQKSRQGHMKVSADAKLIGLVVFASIAGGLLATAIGSFTQLVAGLRSIEAGDWLQSCAAIVGVGLTIWATLWLEDRRRTVELRSEQQLLRDGLALLKGFIPAIREDFPAQMSRANRILLVAGEYEMLRTGYDSLAYAKAGLRIRDFNLWNNLTYIEASFTARKPQLTREENTMKAGMATDAVLAISRGILIDFIDEIEAPIGNALAALDKPML